MLTDSLVTKERHGILGSRVLSRFRVIFDFPNAQLYLKPLRNYNKDFRHDRSGLFLLASGYRLKDITVVGLIKASPAAKAGIKEGDVVIRINGRFKANLSLGMVLGLLQKKAGKKIQLLIERDGMRLKKTFHLQDLI